MTWTSTVPAAMTNLVAIFRAEAGLAGVTIRDGPELTDAAATEVLAVGYLGPDDDSTASGAYAFGDLSARTSRETYTIVCAIAVAHGDEEDVTGARARALALYNAAGNALTNNITLRGAVMKAGLGGWSLRQDQATGGMYERLRFEVTVDAFTGR